jgi:putative CRISPR-associated protein (TIGR02619 family)
MARTIICPVGLSIFQGKRGLNRLGITLTPGHELQQAQGVIAGLGAEADALSAELATLKRMGAGGEDTAVFLATDTDAGEQAAWVNAALAEERFGVADPEVERIAGLVLDDATRFRTVGIHRLIRAMEAHAGRGLEAGREPVLSVSGGIKPVVPYVAVYGMLRGIPITYIFEVTGELITLPPLPIGFDWATLALAEPVLGEIERETAIDRKRLEALLGDDWRRLHGLFEEVDGQATVSALGQMVLDIRRRGVAQPVMLSPSARQRLDRLRGTEQKAVEGMLDRVRNPLIRAHKIHTFHGTDLDVYKPGNTGPRLAYWVEGDRVHVAEVYATHNDYVRDLPGRVKAAYAREEFVEHYPESILSPADDPLSDETVIVALREQARAERERDAAMAAAARASEEREQALALAADVEGQCNEMRRSGRQLEERLAGLEGALREMRSWGVWRRLRWAVFGGRPGPADLS